MAFIKDKKSKSGWVISIQDLGLNTTFSTKESSKPKAKETLTKVQFRIDQLKKNKDDEFFTYNSKEKRRFVTTGYRPEKSAAILLDLETAAADFVAFKINTGKAYATTKNYKELLSRAVEFFGEIAVNNLTPSLLQNYVFYLQKLRITKGRNIGQLLSVESQKKYVARIRSLCRWTNARQLTTVDLQMFDSVVFKPKATTKLSQLTSWVDFDSRLSELERFNIDPTTEGAFSEIIFTRPQLDVLLKEMEEKLWVGGDFEQKQFFVTLYFIAVTGVRRSELSRVRKQDVFLQDRQVTVWLRKGRKDLELRQHKRYLPESLIPYLSWLLKSLPQKQQSIFVNNDKHIVNGTFDQIAERQKSDMLSKRLRSAFKNTRWANAAGFHKFRHTLASMMLTMSFSQTEVKETIGWCSDEMADRYQHLLVERKREVIEKVFAN